ncbi:hypothetical protein YC2023_020157 [Brassica napus]
MESTSRRGETYEEASKRDKRNSQGLMEVGGHVVKEIFDLQEKKKNCWTFFDAAAQVYGGRIHESVESVEMISSYEIRVSLEFSMGARISYCVRRTSGDVLIYVGISARMKGVSEGLKEIDSCGAYEGKIKWVYMVSRLLRQGVHSDCNKGNFQDEELSVYGLLRSFKLASTSAGNFGEENQ